MLEQWPAREPETFAQGDTLCWRRTFRDYPSGEGWQLTYSLAGGVQPIKFQSTPDTDGVSHLVLVASPITANWLPANYILFGQAVLPANEGNPARQHQFYEAPCVVTPNALALPGNVDLRSNAEKALEQAWATYNQINADFLTRSKNGETEFDRQPLKSALDNVFRLREVVRSEKGRADAKMGKPNRNKIRMRARITPVIGVGVAFGGPGYPPFV